MISILSEKTDISTSYVMSWLAYLGYQTTRYNGEKRTQLAVDMDIENFHLSFLSHNSQILLNQEFNSIWFRRPYNIGDDLYCTSNFDLGGIIPNDEVNQKIKDHFTSLKSFIFENYPAKKLGSYSITRLNKLDTLLKAKEVGLDIPKSIISNSRKTVINFLKRNIEIICKPIEEGIRYVPIDEDYWISNKTILINDERKIPRQFDVSLFQECLDKRYELRIFYLDGVFYNSCIFSQKNEKTKVDFRNYDFDKPNRIVPYNLNGETKKKLVELMSILKLNTGSIVLVKS